jgi:hypothetical protein
MTTLPIPKIYWDVLQSALQTKVKRLAKEIASSIGQPEQPLLKALVTEKVSVYLFEEEGSEFIDLPSMRCKHYRQIPENPLVVCACNQPVLLGDTACLLHKNKELQPLTLPIIREVRDTETGISYWIDSENTVRDKKDMSLIGSYSNKRIILFSIGNT